MSDAKLKEIVEKNRSAQCIAFFQGMTEADRRRLAPECLQLLKQAKKGENDFVVAEAAVLATATLSELKAVSWRVAREQDLAFAIVSDRKPEWTAVWADKLLQESFYWAHWTLIRRLVRAGLIPKPTSPNYILAMISGLVGGRFEQDKSIEEHLLADPELLEDEVWRLFEHEGGGENSLANWDRFGRSQSWHDALVSLATKGRLPRKRLLDSSLAALERDFNQYRAKWFATFHDGLAPTTKELREHAPQYLRLVGASATNIASWALEIVGKLAPEDAYDAAALVAGLQPALTSRQKATAKQALQLLDAAAANAANKRELLRAAAAALGHEATDVQKAALDLLEKHASAIDTDLAATIAGYSSLVAASLRGRLSRWTKEDGKRPTKAAKGSAASEFKLPKVAPETKKLWSIEALLANIKAGRAEIPAAIFDGTDIPRLKIAERLQPVADLDELIDVCARVVENEELVDDAERAFDGLSRLCDQKPDDFARRIGPLAKRVTQRLKKNAIPFLGNGPGDDLCGLVYAWSTGQVIEWKRNPERRDGTVVADIAGERSTWFAENLRKGLGFLSRRSIALARRVAAGQPGVLLSAPTHAGGWIDAAVLVERANAWKVGEPELTDICLALLRLAPDGKEKALSRLKETKTEWNRALRHALGAPRIAIGDTAALWIAAARSRAPWADDERVEKAFPALGPDAGKAATMTVSFKKDRMWTRLKVHSAPPPSKSADPQIVTVTLHTQRGVGHNLTFELGDSSGRTVGSVRWSATIWPLARESLCAASLETIAGNLDWSEAAWQNKALLEPLLDPRTPLRQMGLLLLTTALAAKEPGEYGLATDIAIRAIEDGRLGSDNLGQAFAQLLPSGIIKPPRWQKTLADVARASPVHALVIQQALQVAFRGQPDKQPRDFGKLLELLLELSVEQNQSVADADCLAFLQRLTSGKAAQTAKALLKLPAADFNTATLPILQQAISLRAQAVAAPSK